MNTEYDKIFLNVAKEISQQSNDWRTKVGAVFVKDNCIISAGCNHTPNKMKKNLLPTENGKKLIEQKNTFMIHAELDAVLNYKGSVSDFIDSTAYITLFPCMNCAKLLAQIGVKQIIYLDEYYNSEEMATSKYILDICNIDYQKYEGE